MNYIVEGNAFYSNLMESICDESENNKDVCLISNNPLETNSIILECGHKFNYEPIFNEIVKQKKKINRLEVQILKKNQIKCPYCRKIQNGILPFDNTFNIRELYVNWPPKYWLHTQKCCAILKSGKRKNESCDKICAGKYCLRHSKVKVYEKCSAIIKTGKRKGEKCNCNIKTKQKFCGKHLKKKEFVNV